MRGAGWLCCAAVALAACRTVPAAPVPENPSSPRPAPIPAWPAEVPGLTAAQLSDGEALVQNNCLACHSVEMLAQQRLSAGQWEAAVKKMRRWGAPLEDEYEAVLVATLAKAFSQDTARYPAPPLTPEEAEAAVAPLPDGPFAGGDARRGGPLFTEACGACHGPEGRGGTIGVNLVDKPRLYRAPEFAAIVRAGKGRMPAYELLSDEQLADLIAFLRSVPG
jgi:mono/diheme cytochrome c family protein